MLVKCEWKTSEVDCKKLFQKTKSTGGFCCSFNYKGLFVGDYGPTNESENVYVGGVGSSYGLKVYLDAELSQYTTTETAGFWVLVHNSRDYPDVLVYGTHLELNSQMSLAVRDSILSSREEIRGIDVETRGCLFTGEVTIVYVLI
ncbi:unnamed protein product [Phaedon cochleariae]|uniref:Uncharacterized protein n=1 Tax=Phaedon cochleariae TaxID=80249 RepID=A0A9N9SHQ0_PHACE|nr:unnamed protein product [Phaedon cochleariae]